MKRSFLIIILTIVTSAVHADNQAMFVDGMDNNVRTGIGFMEAPWTLEAWIKGDDCSWKETEVIFGGGEYSTMKRADNLPLVIHEGRLCNQRSGLRSERWMDDQWHHVAMTCDGSRTAILMDGEVVASKDTVMTVIPGALGICEQKETAFRGNIDEVRIWKAAVAPEEIKRWKDCPVDPSHPDFAHLIAYYNFDAGITETAINWMGSGYLSYHLRSGRYDYKGNAPLAYTEKNTNEQFKPYTGSQRLFNAVSIESEWDADCGTLDNQVMKLRIAVQGTEQPMHLEKLELDLTETDRLSDLSAVHLYSTGKLARSTQKVRLYSGSPRRTMTIELPAERRLLLSEGINYVLVTADVATKARLGDRIRIKVKSFTLDGKEYTPSLKETHIHQQVTENSFTNPDCFRLLQWNIWHGGNHVPLAGHDRIIELIKASRADIVTMQEGYGTQEKIAAALHYHLQTPSAGDNLALFSRYPLDKQPSSNTFRSNPAIVDMGNGRSVLVNDCWVRYAYNPEYTGTFSDTGHDVSAWIAQDSIYPMADAKQLLDKDMDPVLAHREMPSIVAGDFNSCSHLDWTERAAAVHAGYGPVSFPASRFMIERGYSDSFREINPDEVERPEGTFAGIYGQLDFSRIDFIYYKGKIRAVSSKIIQTAPEIDDIWASDHSAVLTTFVWK